MSTKEVIKACFVVTLFAGAILLLVKAYSVLLLVFGGILFAIYLRHSAQWLHTRLRIPLGFSLAVTVLSTLVIIGSAFYFFAPDVSGQLSELRQRLSEAPVWVRSRLSQYRLGNIFLNALGDFESYLPELRERIFNMGRMVLGALGASVVVVVVGVYFALNPERYTNGVVHLFPKHSHRRAYNILNRLDQTLLRWLLGRLAAMVIVGITTAIGLYLIGIPFALSLSVIMAFLDWVPNFGPIIAAIPALLLAFAEDFSLVAYVVLLYLVIQSLEGYLLSPLIQQNAVDTPPALLIPFQIVMGILMGPLGLLFATPLLACLLVLVKEIYVKDYLEDAGSEVP